MRKEKIRQGFDLEIELNRDEDNLALYVSDNFKFYDKNLYFQIKDYSLTEEAIENSPMYEMSFEDVLKLKAAIDNFVLNN